METPPENEASARRRTAWLGLLVLLVVPLFLRLWPIGHGDGVNYLADTHVVRAALGMARDRNPVPDVGEYSTYPNLLPYALLPVYVAEYVGGRAVGAWSGPGEFEYAIKERPALVHLPARVLVALLGALTPLLVFRTCRVVGLRAGAWVAAWLVATGLLHVHFSVQERPWGPLVFFFALAALFAAQAVRDGSSRRLLFSGVAAGLGFATHQAGLVGLGICGLAWLVMPWGWRGADLKRRLVQGVLCCALFGVVALLLGHPYYLVHGAPEAAQVAAGEALEERGGLCFSIGGQGVCLSVSGHTLRRLSAAFFGYDPALVLLALAGLVFALRQRALLPGLVFALLWGAFFLTNFNDHVRYLLPLSVLLAPAAGAAAERLWALRPARVALLLLLLLPLVQSLRLGQLLRRADTRTLARDHLVANEVPGTIAVDAFGPELPLDADSLQRLMEFRELGSREGHRLEYYAHDAEPPGPRGLDALPVNALVGMELRRSASWFREDLDLADHGDTLEAVLRSLGVTHLLVADRRPADGHESLLVDDRPADPGWERLAPVPVERPAVVEFDPARGAPPAHARLPTEMEFPLTGLWTVSRPGPHLALHRLAD